MAQNTVTGCIVTHNNARTIEKTVGTLLENTKDVDFKLYIVDNLSTDDTLELIRKKFGSAKNLEIIETGTNKGFGAGHNVVIPKLDSLYHIVINPDIEVRDNAVFKMAEYLNENPDIGILSPRICFPSGKDQILGKRNPTLKYLVASRMREKSFFKPILDEYAMLDNDMSKPFDIENASGCFLMIRTDVFREIGGFDDKYFMYFEDCDITRTVRKQKRAVYYPQAVIYHVWGRESKKKLKFTVIQIKSMLHYFRKWR